MTGKIRAICRAEKKGTPKVRVERAELVAGHGIVRDAHAGPWHRQVSLLDCEDIYRMRKSLPDLEFGAFAENIVLEGIDCIKLGLCSRLRLGTKARIQITQIGKECHQRCVIFYKTGDCIMPSNGLFARVLEGGDIATGDPVEVLEFVDRKHLQVVVLDVLDRYSDSQGEDYIPVICEFLRDKLDVHVYRVEIVPDETSIIASRLEHYSRGHSIDLVLTIGGTGFFPPNAAFNSVRRMIQKVPPGLEESIKTLSAPEQQSEGNLSGFSGIICDRTLIVCLPGPQVAAAETLKRILPALERALKRLRLASIENKGS